jgi:hypothetical protein
MTKALYYPAANRTVQNFAGAFPGVIFSSLRALVLHTTETSGWPGYAGGASAPTFTALPDYANKKLIFRQHFPLNMSARALKNLSGGVNTNTTNVVQIELVGTSARGGPGMFWPEAPDWALNSLADFVKFLNAEWGIPMTSSVKWVSYPASYGFNASQRLSGNAWLNYRGILGHQHVAENDHGDPGLFPAARLLSFTKEDDLPLNDADKKYIAETVASAVRAALDADHVELDAAVRKALYDYWVNAWVHNPPMATPNGTVVPDEKTGRVAVSPLGMINEAFYKVDTVEATQKSLGEALIAQGKQLVDLAVKVNKLTPTQPTS